MCTVTRYSTAAGYELLFNRDELRARAPATPPTEAVAAGVRYLAPTDGEAGGSWVAANELGTTVGLLNAHPPAASAPRDLVSRGHLVRRLAGLDTAGRLEERIATLEIRRLRPFTVFAVSADGAATVLDWDGGRLTTRDPGSLFLLSSSSVDSLGAETARRRLLESLLREHPSPAQGHREFHRSHLPDHGPLAPCMHRDDARTVSFTRVEVTADLVRLFYAPGPPCRTPTSSRTELPRAAAVSTSSRRGE